MVLLVENVHQRSSHCLLLSSYLSFQPPSTGTSHTLRHENSASSTSGHQRGKCQGSGFWFCGCFDERLASGSQPLPFACQTVKWLSSLHPPSLGPSGWTLNPPSLGPSREQPVWQNTSPSPHPFFTSSFCSFLVEGEVYRALFFPINQHVRHGFPTFPSSHWAEWLWKIYLVIKMIQTGEKRKNKDSFQMTKANIFKTKNDANETGSPNFIQQLISS